MVAKKLILNYVAHNYSNKIRVCIATTEKNHIADYWNQLIEFFRQFFERKVVKKRVPKNNQTMLVVTNRNLQENDETLKRFGVKFNSEGSDELRLAKVSLSGNEWSVDVVEDVVRDDTNGDSTFASEREFIGLQKRLKENNKNCVVFVHGFNQSFEEAVKDAWAIQENYGVEVVLFTWPSNGREGGVIPGKAGGTIAYKNDKRDAVRSKEALDRLFEKLHFYLSKYNTEDDVCNRNISLMCHSMGNYLLKNLMRSSIYQGETAIFDNIIMASADVNNEGHDSWIDRLEYRKQLYITINENDFALAFSRIKLGKHQKARLGHFTNNLCSRKAIYLDFTHSDGVKKSHSYYGSEVIDVNATVKSVFTDILNGNRIKQNITASNYTKTFTIQ